MKVLDDTKLLPGDIILSTTDAFVSKAIRKATASDISHAMVYVMRGSLIESTGEGVHSRNTQRMLFDDDCSVHVRRFPDLPKTQLGLVINYARSHIGTRYSKQEAVKSAFGGSLQTSRRQFCSRLVAQAYAHAGILLVKNPDYCTPEQLKNSPLLVAVPDVLVEVSDEYVAQMRDDLDTNEVTRKATMAILASARQIHPGIEHLDDIDEYLVANPDDDDRFAAIFDESGYLTGWQVEFHKNRWQYELPLLVAVDGSLEDKRAYCISVVEDHQELHAHRAAARAGYAMLNSIHPRKTFAKLLMLHDTLVDLQFDRRNVALRWLDRSSGKPSSTATPSVLVPHSKEWFAILERQDPQRVRLINMVLKLAGTLEACGVCGDRESIKDYQYSGDCSLPDTIFTYRLCEDCHRIRLEEFGEAFSPL